MNYTTNISPDLARHCIFLSASFPNQHRAPEYFRTTDPDELAEAILAFVRTVLSANGRVVFGGHPAVSSLVQMASEDFSPRSVHSRRLATRRDGPSIVVYQSSLFRKITPSSTLHLFKWGLAQLAWTTKASEKLSLFQDNTLKNNGSAKSLEIMREKMLKEQCPLAAVFIGGMEGIAIEARLFQKLFPDRPIYFIGGPGGASRELARRMIDISSARLSSEDLTRSRSYPFLMQRIVMDIAETIKH